MAEVPMIANVSWSARVKLLDSRSQQRLNRDQGTRVDTVEWHESRPQKQV